MSHSLEYSRLHQLKQTNRSVVRTQVRNEISGNFSSQQRSRDSYLIIFSRKHADMICKIANSTLAFLRRNLYHCQEMYNQMLIKLNLRIYCDSLGPLQLHSTKYQSIQQQAARFVLSDFSTYSSVTVMLSMEHITSQKAYNAVNDAFQDLHNLVELCLPNYIAYNTSATRGHKDELSIPFSRVDVYKHSFSPSTIPKWNSLTASTVELASVDSFVIYLDIAVHSL